MKIRALISFIILFGTAIHIALAQDNKKDILNTVATQIDFLINSQQTEELYTLGNEELRAKASKAQFEKVMDQVYSLGRIQSLSLDSIDSDTQNGIYTMKFKEAALKMELGVDENQEINHLKFFPKEKLSEDTDPDPEEQHNDTEQVTIDSSLEELIHQQSRDFLSKNDSATLSIALLHNNQIKRFIFSKEDDKVVVTDSSKRIYELGSVSHIFTATLLGKLAEEGKLDLDSSIYPYLPDSIQTNASLKNITFRNLADYSAGLPSMELAHPDLNNKLDSYQKITYSDIYTFLKNIDFEQEEFPVSEFNYMYYALLTEVIANQQNEDYFSLLKKNIIEPLKLTHTQYLDDFKAEELSPVFDKTDETERLRFDALKESTELQSSLEDMISFTRQQLLFAENSLQKGMTLTRDLSSFDERDQAVGLAWQSEMTEGMVYYYIQGNTPGSSAFVTIIPDIKSALIVLSNTPLDTQNFSKTILNQMIQE